ncbi:MAG: mandelate racemase/muconate lactonizing enzyme family protein, partial [Gemmatimonadetes bacterium]|nr:mandelate racemase/muconate lactonizing enzyme family protein [Gemmatimonadota bacterium]
AAATPNFKILEYVLPVGTEWEQCIIDPYLPEDGYLPLRDTPGLGIDVDEEAVKDNEVVHWQRTCYVRPDGSTGYI